VSGRLGTDQRSSHRTRADVEAGHRPQCCGRYGNGGNDAAAGKARRRGNGLGCDGGRCRNLGRRVAEGSGRENVFECCVAPNTSPLGPRPLHDPPLKSRIKRRSCRPEPTAPEFRNPLCFNHIAAQAKREPRLLKLVAFSSNSRLEFENQSRTKGIAHQSRGRVRTPSYVVKSLSNSASD